MRPLGLLNAWGMENRRRWIKSLSFRFLDRPAFDRAQRQQRHRDAVERIVSRRSGTPAVSESQFNAARREPRS